ncbi:MAG: tetratricopeptide repeat protein, partial [Nitrospiria bacterium]
NPKDVEALIALGNANMMISRFEAAQELYSRVLAIQPKNLDVRTSLAIAYQYGGKSDQALAELKQNLRYDAKHDATLFNLGFLYHDVKKDPAAAREVWTRWLTWYPNAPAAADIGRRVAAIESAIGTGGAISRK